MYQVFIAVYFTHNSLLLKFTAPNFCNSNACSTHAGTLKKKKNLLADQVTATYLLTLHEPADHKPPVVLWMQKEPEMWTSLNVEQLNLKWPTMWLGTRVCSFTPLHSHLQLNWHDARGWHLCVIQYPPTRPGDLPLSLLPLHLSRDIQQSPCSLPHMQIPLGNTSVLMKKRGKKKKKKKKKKKREREREGKDKNFSREMRYCEIFTYSS